jgi:5-methylcytosine-specific restriction endonuclease McrA
MRVDRQASGVYLELSTKKGNGFYSVNDPMMAEAVIDTLVRMDKRQLLAPQPDAASRHIPHDVRQAVWQRDQGLCVQCRAATYLEFDHIIPFSKGGASTENNVQLLCRRCNLAKGSRL